MMKNGTEIRDAFWATFCVEGKPREFYGKTGNQLPANVRAAFAEFVQYLLNAGTISATLADVTL